jgi:hypothetical protein
MKALILLGTSFLISHFGNSQIDVVKDTRIDGLVKMEGTAVAPETSVTMNGYRVQLAFDSDKSVVDEARSKFTSLYPKVDTYLEFIAPHYFLKVGDFRTQLEAEEIKANTGGQFPTAFIVKEKINLPRLDQ